MTRNELSEGIKPLKRFPAEWATVCRFYDTDMNLLDVNEAGKRFKAGEQILVETETAYNRIETIIWAPRSGAEPQRPPTAMAWENMSRRAKEGRNPLTGKPKC